ncbi:MAG: hypothetical protein ACRDTX_27180 [Pseudonocardiaceae bacterium]
MARSAADDAVAVSAASCELLGGEVLCCEVLWGGATAGGGLIVAGLDL